MTIDIASQLLKSRNAGVLRTGGAALRSAAALADQVIAPAVEQAPGSTAGAVQLVRSADRAAAVELVRQPGLIPLVILRGSGDTTRSLAAEAAQLRGAHARARRRWRRAVPGPGRRSGAGRRADHQPAWTGWACATG